MRILIGLQGVVAAHRLVDKGEGRRRGFEKECIAITANETVEGCKLGRTQALGVPGRYLSILSPCSLVSSNVDRDGGGGEALTM